MALVIYIGADHGGYELKEKIRKALRQKYTIKDMGTHSADISVDYPDYAKMVAQSVVKHRDAFGILICGTGIGMCIAANKFKGARAALAYNKYSAKMAKEHNNANILCLGGRAMKATVALGIVKEWLKYRFSGDERHKRRLNKIRHMGR